MGCDKEMQSTQITSNEFQFTHPMWGATPPPQAGRLDSHVSIHAPHVGCDHQNEDETKLQYVSIHAPHVGCDCDAQRYALVED